MQIYNDFDIDDISPSAFADLLEMEFNEAKANGVYPSTPSRNFVKSDIQPVYPEVPPGFEQSVAALHQMIDDEVAEINRLNDFNTFAEIFTCNRATSEVAALIPTAEAERDEFATMKMSIFANLFIVMG